MAELHEEFKQSAGQVEAQEKLKSELEVMEKKQEDLENIAELHQSHNLKFRLEMS